MAEETEEKQTLAEGLGAVVGGIYNKAKEFGEQVQSGFDEKVSEEDDNGDSLLQTETITYLGSDEPSDEENRLYGKDQMNPEFGNMPFQGQALPPQQGQIPPAPNGQQPDMTPMHTPAQPHNGPQIMPEYVKTPEETLKDFQDGKSGGINIMPDYVKTPEELLKDVHGSSHELANQTKYSRGSQAEEAFEGTFDDMDRNAEAEEETGKQKD